MTTQAALALIFFFLLYSFGIPFFTFFTFHIFVTFRNTPCRIMKSFKKSCFNYLAWVILSTLIVYLLSNLMPQ